MTRAPEPSAGPEVARGYLTLVASLDRLLPGTLDTFPGPGTALPAPPPGPARPADLVRLAGRLADALPADLPPDRARFLAAQLRACEQTARRLTGQRVPFTHEVAATFGVRVTPGAEDDHRAAHRELDDLLPGTGPLPARLAAHRARERVPRARLLPAARALADALRTATARRLPLPAGETVAFRLVDDAPWAALHRYAGGYRSLVTLHAGAGLRVGQLARLVAHETYPGHHAERCRKEAGLVAAGWVEHRAVVANTPQSLVAEGAAEIALPAAVGPRWGRFVQDVLAEHGVRCDGELAQRVDAVTARLATVRQDAVVALHGHRAGERDVRAYLRRWLLLDDAGATRVLRFLRDPLWRLSTIASVEGAALVGRWWAADPTDVRLAHLLDAALTPSDLQPNVSSRAAP